MDTQIIKTKIDDVPKNPAEVGIVFEPQEYK